MIQDQEPAQTGMEPVALEETAEDNEAARKRAREFDDAIYAALDCRAQSDQAGALVNDVIRLVTEAEAAAAKRTNKRGKKQADLRAAVEGFLADLLRAQGSAETTHGYVYRAMRPATFTNGPIGYRVFRDLVDALVSLGFMESYAGFQSWSASFDDSVLPHIRKATRFRATQGLLDLCASHGIAATDFHKHFLQPLPENPLQLRATARTNEFGRKISGKMMRYERTDATDNVQRSLKHLNTFLDGFRLTGGVHRGYVRIFNNGDDARFDWNMGGRLYSHGEDTYQQMSREARLQMRIDLDRVCEIDIRASYLTILHAWCGEQLDPKRDPYNIEGLGPERRDLVKRWVTASFGSNAPIIKWPRELRQQYLDETGKTLGKQDSAAKIGAKVLAAYPVLTKLGEIVGGHKLGWAETMYAESRAMFRTMLDLMEEKIPSLTVHDSIIVPELKFQWALSALRKNYQTFTGANPVLVAHAPEGVRLLLPTGTDEVYNIIATQSA